MAKKTETIPDAIVEPATLEELIQAIAELLGHDASDVASIDIRPRNIRVLGKDRSLRSYKITEWNPDKEEAE